MPAPDHSSPKAGQPTAWPEPEARSKPQEGGSRTHGKFPSISEHGFEISLSVDIDSPRPRAERWSGGTRPLGLVGGARVPSQAQLPLLGGSALWEKSAFRSTRRHSRTITAKEGVGAQDRPSLCRRRAQEVSSHHSRTGFAHATAAEFATHHLVQKARRRRSMDSRPLPACRDTPI